MAILLREQFWCWMHDADDDNRVLHHYGFALDRAGSHYIDEPLCIALMPFGVTIRRQDAQLFVPQCSFEPLLISAVAAQSTPLTRTTDAFRMRLGLDLLRELFAWIGGYERWVIDSFGADYRGRILGVSNAMVSLRPKRWWSLALRVSDALERRPRSCDRAVTRRLSVSLT